MISLGDVNFNLGADTRRLDASVRSLQRFSQVVDRAAQSTDRATQQTARALQRQEAATINALNRVLNLNQQMRRLKGGEQFANDATTAFIRLNKQMTSGVLSAQQYQRVMSQFRISLANTQRGFRSLQAEMTGQEGRFKHLTEAMQNLASTSLLVAGPLSGIATRIVALTAVIRRGGFAVAGFFAGIAAGIYTIHKFGGVILDAGRQMNSFQSMLTAVTGSVGRANVVFNKIVAVADNTGNAVQQMVAPFTRFQAAVAGTSLEGEESYRIFQTIAAASSKLQLGVEQTQGVFRAFEQMISKGNVQAEELRGQLGDRLPGAFQIAARAMGVTTAQLNDMLKKGKVLAEDFLPKFTTELAKALGIDGTPIDNFTASLGRLSTEWFLLRTAVDKQLGVTEKAKRGLDLLKDTLATLRFNLDSATVGVIALTGALTALTGVSIIRNLTTIVGFIGRVGAGLAALVGLGVGSALVSGIVALSIALAGAGAALGIFGQDLRISQKSAATWGDLMSIVGEKFRQRFGGAIKAVRDAFNKYVPSIGKWLDKLGDWFSIDQLGSLKTWVNAFIKSLDILVVIFSGFWDNLVTTAQSGWNSLINALPGSESLKSRFTIEPDTARLERMKSRLDEINRIANGDPFGNWMGEAERRGRSRDEDRVMSLPVQIDPNNLDKQVKKMSQIVELTKEQLEAMQDIEREISRTQQMNLALMGTDQQLEALQEQFKREDTVKRFADALRDEGIATSYITEKTRELTEALIQQANNEKIREGILQIRDSLVDAFDSVGMSIFENIGKGKEFLDSLVDTAKAAARDILNTFFQLSVLNPIKNSLFGTTAPTYSGGLGGVLGSLGGLFGGGFPAGGTSFGSGLFAEGSAFNSSGLITTPTAFAYGNGNIGVAGEAGEEAIVPLARDPSGNLGIKSIGGGSGDGGVIVNVIMPEGSENSKVSKSERTGPNNERIVDVIITKVKESIVEDISSGSSAINRGLETRYSLNNAASIRRA